MSYFGTVGFLTSLWLFSEYSSNHPHDHLRKKYDSYHHLKSNVIPTLKTGDTDEISEGLKSYFWSLRREIFKSRE